MLTRIPFLVLAIVLLAQNAISYAHCPEECICWDVVAKCSSLNITNLDGTTISNLKIFDPKKPLVLNAQSFNVTGLRNVNSIVIENATIIEINKSAFAGLPALLTLSIVNSKLPNLSSHLISSINLKKLKISNSTLTVFENLYSRSLEELDLSGCSLRTIKNSSFFGLPNLIYLNLAKNQIENVDAGAFLNLPSLQEIDLSGNSITHLNRQIFLNNKALSTIDLSNNPMLKVDLHIDAELEKLVLNSLDLQQFEVNLKADLSLLNYLDLSHNKIRLSKSTFAKMDQLEYIDLSNNGLEDIDPQIFRLNDVLQKIILDNNNLTVLPKFINFLGEFETYSFSCRNCNLMYLLKNTFQQLRALVMLDLSYNQLNGINLTAIQSLQRIIKLDLSYNKIAAINPQSFVRSTSLEELKLTGNPLLNLDTSLFINNRVLRYLDLSFCNLTHLWELPIRKNLTSIQIIDISNNSISSIGKDELVATPSLKVFDISNNPIECNEKLSEAITWLSNNGVSSPSTNTWRVIENMERVQDTKEIVESPWTWKNLAKKQCSPEYYKKHFEETTENISPLIFVKIEGEIVNEIHTTSWVDIDDFGNQDNDSDESAQDYINPSVKVEIDTTILAEESAIHERRQQYSFLWPTLVFIFTALTVLVIAANILLMMVRSRMNHRNQIILPRFKIPQWNSQGKIKKHSGSIYRPLSEEFTVHPIVKKEYVPTHQTSCPK